VRESSGFRAICETALGEDAVEVLRHCVSADDEFLGDLPIAAAGGEEAQDLYFAGRKLSVVRTVWPYASTLLDCHGSYELNCCPDRLVSNRKLT
jgi:hypothetical protein